MSEPFYTRMLQALHVGGGWLAFGAAPIALLARKGSRRHVWAGRCFLLALTIGITAGLVLATIDRAIGLFFFGLLTLFLPGDRVLGSSYRAGLAILLSVGPSPHGRGRYREPRAHRRRPDWEYIAVGRSQLRRARPRDRGGPRAVAGAARPVALASGTSHEPARGVYRRLELHPRPVRWAAEAPRASWFPCSALQPSCGLADVFGPQAGSNRAAEAMTGAA